MFCRSRRVPRVTTIAIVSSGPASSGQQRWMGRRVTSTSLPVSTSSRNAASGTRRGATCASCANSGQAASAWRRLAGQRGSLTAASSSPSSRREVSGRPASAASTRVRWPNRLPSSACDEVPARSNSRAGPPARCVRRQKAVLSSTGSTGSATRRSCPFASRRARKVRRSWQAMVRPPRMVAASWRRWRRHALTCVKCGAV